MNKTDEFENYVTKENLISKIHTQQLLLLGYVLPSICIILNCSSYVRATIKKQLTLNFIKYYKCTNTKSKKFCCNKSNNITYKNYKNVIQKF